MNRSSTSLPPLQYFSSSNDVKVVLVVSIQLFTKRWRQRRFYSSPDAMPIDFWTRGKEVCRRRRNAYIGPICVELIACPAAEVVPWRTDLHPPRFECINERAFLTLSPDHPQILLRIRLCSREGLNEGVEACRPLVVNVKPWCYFENSRQRNNTLQTPLISAT